MPVRRYEDGQARFLNAILEFGMIFRRVRNCWKYIMRIVYEERRKGKKTKKEGWEPEKRLKIINVKSKVGGQGKKNEKSCENHKL